MDDQLFQLIKSDMDEMKKDIKTLLAFKWQIIGYSAGVSIIVGIGFQILVVLFNKP